MQVEMKKISHPLTLSNRYSENSNFNLKFCVVLCNAILKSYAKNEENLFKIFFY